MSVINNSVIVEKGIVERIMYRNIENSFYIFSFNNGSKTISCKGNFCEIVPGDYVEVEGTYDKSWKGQYTLMANKVSNKLPTTKKFLIKFLSSGKISGVGEKTAEKIINHLGLSLIEVFEKDPNCIFNIPKINKKQAKSISLAIESIFKKQTLEIFLTNLNISKTNQLKLIKLYDKEIIGILKNKPYDLIGKIKGFGFKEIDKVAIKLGVEHDSIERIIASIIYTLNTQILSSGSTIISKENLLNGILSLANLTNEKINEAINHLINEKKIIETVLNKETYYSTKEISSAENEIAHGLSEIIKKRNKKHITPEALDEKLEKTGVNFLAKCQKQALLNCLNNNISIITGGPGTGKTTIVKTVINIAMEHFEIDEHEILLVSPTGRAAQRLEESTGIKGKTIHRALGCCENNFIYDKQNKLPHKLIVIDETTMADTYLFSWLIRALKPSVRLIIVGDVDQLASVGPGQVLKDLIDSEIVTVSYLTEIFRQHEGSKIAKNAKNINMGMPIIVNHKDKNNDFWFFEANHDNDILNKIIQIVPRMCDYYNFNPLKDVQILSPMKDGVVGVNNLNKKLQDIYMANKESPLIVKTKKNKDEERKFFLNDRVMQIENNKEKKVFNGTIGKIINIEKNSSITVDFGNVVCKYNKNELNEIVHAYAITIHKSQGGEFPLVIMPLTMSHSIMLDRNLFYTGTTRAKQQIAYIGTKQAINFAINNIKDRKRQTMLVNYLKSIKTL